MVIIDNDQETVQILEDESVPYIVDDATSEDVLIEAGDTLISLGKSDDLNKPAKVLSVGTGGARSK